MGPTWIPVARILELRIPVAWQEAVQVARAAFLASESRGRRLTLEGCQVSTDGQVRVGEQGTDRLGRALSELQLLRALLDGQKVPPELRDILASADDALSSFPSEQDPAPRSLSLEWFVGADPALEIASLATRAVDAERGMAPAPLPSRTPTHPLGTDYEPPPLGGRPPSGSRIKAAQAPPPVVTPPPPVVTPPPTPVTPPSLARPAAARNTLAAFPAAGLSAPVPPTRARALDARPPSLIDRALAAVSGLSRGELATLGVAAGVAVLAAAVAAFAWLRSGSPPPLESRALPGAFWYAPTVTPDVPLSPSDVNLAARGGGGLSGANRAAVGRPPTSIGLAANEPAPVATAPAPPTAASSRGGGKVPVTAGSPTSSRTAGDAIAVRTPALDLRVYSAEDTDVEPPIWRRPQLPSEPKPDSDATDSFVELIVDEHGEVAQVRLHSSDVSLNDRMIIAAAKAWQFQPARKDGRPVRYVLRLPVTR